MHHKACQAQRKPSLSFVEHYRQTNKSASCSGTSLLIYHWPLKWPPLLSTSSRSEMLAWSGGQARQRQPFKVIKNDYIHHKVGVLYVKQNFFHLKIILKIEKMKQSLVLILGRILQFVWQIKGSSLHYQVKSPSAFLPRYVYKEAGVDVVDCEDTRVWVCWCGYLGLRGPL